jgi:hypothetical protein
MLFLHTSRIIYMLLVVCNMCYIDFIKHYFFMHEVVMPFNVFGFSVKN